MADHIGPYRLLTVDEALRRLDQRPAVAQTRAGVSGQESDPLTFRSLVEGVAECRGVPVTKALMAECARTVKRYTAQAPSFGPGVTIKEYLDSQAPAKRFPLTPRLREFCVLAGCPDFFDRLYDEIDDNPEVILDAELALDSMKGAAIQTIEARKGA